jgi:flagellar biosynthetic protein FliR
VEILPLSYEEFKVFFLILIRVSVILFMFPFFSSRVIPVLTKAGLALIITVILYPVIDTAPGAFPTTLWGMARMVLSELIVGMILGLLVQMFFEGVRIMGQTVGFQTGFAITNILDPQSGMQVSILSNMAYLAAMVLFLLLNGHHILLGALRESFETITVGSLNLNKQIFQRVIATSGDMFVIAIKIGAPAIAALLFTKVAFGLITKLMPQMNIMIVAFPVQIVVGLLFFGVCLSVLLGSMEKYVGGLGPVLTNTMSWLKV